MFDGFVQRVGGKLQTLVMQINLTRRMMRNRVRLAREIGAAPVLKTWQESRPRPIGLELLDRVSLQLERAEEARPVKQAEPKPVEPIFQGLWDLRSRPKTIEAPQVEVIEQPAEVEVEPRPAHRWEKSALL